MSRLRDAIDGIVFARKYTRELLDTIPASDWFRMPTEGVTHVAWQVGHLAYANYRLGMLRVRGERPDDAELLPPALIAPFKPESTPSADVAAYPSVEEIRGLFDRVHERLLTELAIFPESDLDTPLAAPHRFCKTRLDSLRWCAAHEMMHAGQIGLLRRLLGQAPMW